MRVFLRACGMCLGVAFVLLCLIGGSCDDDPPNGPDHPGPVKDYVFYCNDGSYSDRYYAYRTAQSSVDTLIIPYDSRTALVVSPAGDRLYLANGSHIRIFSTDSITLVRELPLPCRGGIAVSPDGRYLAALDSGLVIVATTDDTEVFFDSTLSGQTPVFSADSRSLYFGALDAAYRVADFAGSPSVTAIPFDVSVLRVVPTPDERKWCVFRQVAWDFGFLEIYDLALDSVVYGERLEPGFADLAVSPDGRFCFYTNPGTLYPTTNAPYQYVTVVDLRRNEPVAWLTTPLLTQDSITWFSPIPENLALSPDGRLLVADGARGQGFLLVLDIASREWIESYYLGHQVDIWDVACQSQP